jgi:hypothetical protein
MSDQRMGRFLRYAVGEIFLVVIGILIALQINNWNEERIESRQIREYALNLAGDIERDLKMIGLIEFQINRLIDQSKEFTSYARGRSIDNFDNAEVFFLTRYTSYRPLEWNRSGMHQLKSSGALRQMRNQTLVERISAYDALTYHLDQDYLNDNRAGEELRFLRNQIIDRNYEEQDLEALDEWIGSLDMTDMESRFVTFRNTAVFKQLHSRQLKLLTNDINDLRRLANQMSEMKFNARVESELPRLRKLATEVLALIQAEYM